ncbi:Signal peptidase complex subunit SPC2 [Spathaspora sp. JA1]|nr:Signal peptidase complex subunit SPC2 [Spathaspora sp. JA1]
MSSELKRTNLNSVNELRQTTDEQLGQVMQQFGYTESFAIIDIKLGLGVATVVIAALLFLVDKKFTFKESYNITVLSIVVYGFFSGLLLLINYRYKNVKYIGHEKKGKQVTIATWTANKYDPIYHVSVTFDDKKEKVVTSFEFTKFFDILGFFNRDAFIKLLGNELEKVGVTSL